MKRQLKNLFIYPLLTLALGSIEVMANKNLTALDKQRITLNRNLTTTGAYQFFIDYINNYENELSVNDFLLLQEASARKPELENKMYARYTNMAIKACKEAEHLKTTTNIDVSKIYAETLLPYKRKVAALDETFLDKEYGNLLASMSEEGQELVKKVMKRDFIEQGHQSITNWQAVRDLDISIFQESFDKMCAHYAHLEIPTEYEFVTDTIETEEISNNGEDSIVNITTTKKIIPKK